jgi:signal transduction histidine kinase
MGSSYIVRNATWSVATLFLLQLLEELKITNTNESISSISAVAAYSVLYGIFAFFGWVAASQIERALDDSLQAKAALLHQKNLLANALASEEYRRQQLQVEELHNIYQFAEIGQQTTLLLHDFANQLTTLSLEIDDPSPAARQHALATIKDINQTMQTVRDTLSNDAGEVVSVTKIVREVVRGYHAKVTSEHIKLHIKTETSQYQAVTYGDGLKLRQIFNILIDNAVHAYASSSKRKARTILVNVKTAQSTVIVSFTDHGAGIPHDQRKLLFSPNHTTKLNGHGIGLYIAKRIIEKQFQGTITLSPKTDFTQFIITLPRIS